MSQLVILIGGIAPKCKAIVADAIEEVLAQEGLPWATCWHPPEGSIESPTVGHGRFSTYTGVLGRVRTVAPVVLVVGDGPQPPQPHLGLKQLAPAELHPSPRNPRKTLAADHVSDLADSMRQLGVLQPLLVRPRAAGGYEIVCGHCRHAAAVAAELPTVPCVVRELDDAAALEAALIENSQRQDVPVLEESDSLCQLVDMGVEVADLQDRLGRSRKWVRDRLALRDLLPAWREKLDAGELALRSGVALAKLPQQIQERLSEDLTRYNQALTHARILDAIRDNGARNLSDAPWDLEATDLDGRGCSGACSTCPLRSDRQMDLWQTPQRDDVVCLDAECWTSKMQTHVARLKASGVEVKEGFEPYNTHRANATCWMADAEEGAEAPTWGEVAPDAKRVYYLRSGGGRLVECIDPEDLAPAVRRAGREELADKLEQPGRGSSSTTPKRKRPAPKALEAAVAAIVGGVEAEVTAAAESSLVALLAESSVFALLARETLASMGATQLKGPRKRRGIEAKSDYMWDIAEHIEGYSAAQLWGLAVEALLQEDLRNARSEHTYGLARTSRFARLCERYQVEIPKHTLMAAAKERELAELKAEREARWAAEDAEQASA